MVTNGGRLLGGPLAPPILALAAGLLALTPTSRAGPDQGEIWGEIEADVAFIPQLQASALGSADVAVVMSTPAQSSLVWSAEEVTGTLHEARFEFSTAAGIRVGAPKDDVRNFTVRAAALQGEGLRRATVAFLLRACPTDPPCPTAKADWPVPSGPLRAVSAVGPSYLIFPETRGPFSTAPGAYDAHRQYAFPGPSIQSAGADLAGYTGPIEFWTWETRVDFRFPNGTTSSFQSGRASEGFPVPGSPLRTETERHLHFVGFARNLSIERGPQASYWIHDATLELPAAQTSLEHATGTIELGGRRFALDDARVDVGHGAGELKLQGGSAMAGRFHVRMTAPMQSIRLDGHPLAIATAAGPGPSPAAIAMGTVALMAIAAGIHHFFTQGAGTTLLSRRTRVTQWAPYVARTLSNPRRAHMYRLITERPGIQPYHVWKAVGGAFGVALRSLERFETVGLVQSVKRGKFRHYFPAGQAVAAVDRNVASLLSTRALGKTRQALAALAPCTERLLRRQLRLSHTAVQARLRRLMDAGLVRRTGRPGRFLYECVPVDGASPAAAASPGVHATRSQPIQAT